MFNSDHMHSPCKKESLALAAHLLPNLLTMDPAGLSSELSIRNIIHYHTREDSTLNGMRRGIKEFIIVNSVVLGSTDSLVTDVDKCTGMNQY